MARIRTSGGSAWRAPWRASLAVLTVLTLLIASCGGGKSSSFSTLTSDSTGNSGDVTSADTLPAGTGSGSLAGGLPALPPGSRKVSQTALLMNGSDQFEAYSGAQVSGNRLVLDGGNAAGMGMAWAVYEFTTTQTAKYPVELRVDVGTDSQPFWLAIGDYSGKRWDLQGPFEGLATMPLLPSGAQNGDFVSPGGSVYAAVLSYNPGQDSRVVVSQLELKLSQNPPPAPPIGLTATTLPGQIHLDWQASTAEGLLGYNVYYSTASFNLPEGTLVTRANDALVPADASPGYDLLELDANKTYYFRVAAVVGDQVESALSNQATAASSYTLFVDEIFPPRQYPGFWVYVTGTGFNPAAGGTKVVWDGQELPAESVKNVSATSLRFRLPLDAPAEQSINFTVKVAGSESNPYPVVTVHPSTAPKNWAHVGKTLYQSFEMYEPHGVASDADGNFYVAQGVAGRISAYHADGTAWHEFWLDDPQDIELLSGGDILVKQGGGPDVYRIQQDTGIITHAIDPAVVDAVYEGGYFLAANSSGSVIYLSDANAGCIRKFEGGAQTQVIGDGTLQRPDDVELDSSGNIVVADEYADKIFWFAPDGNLIDSYDGSQDLDPDDGELSSATGVACFSDGTVLVTDRDRDRVLRFNAAHDFDGEWGASGYSEGNSQNLPGALGVEAHFWSLWGICPIPGGRVLVSDEFNDTAGLYGKGDGLLQQGLGDYQPLPGEFVQPQSIAVRESDGTYAVLDGATYMCTLLSRANKVLDSAYLETGIDGDILTGRLDRTPSEVAWGGGSLYFTHGYTKLTQYSDDFNTYKVLGVDWGSQPGEFKGNGSMVADGGTLYALDRENDRVQVFANGTYDHSIALPDPANTGADSMVIDKDHGWLFILDRPWNDNSRVMRLDLATGSYIDALDLDFGFGGILAIDPAGYIYVYYWDSDGLLHKFKPPASAGGEWTYMTGLAPYGDEDGAVRNIYGVTISPDGRFLIGDRDRRQVVILTP